MLRPLSAFTALLLITGTALAQVTDLPAGPYGGMFRDESTGKAWLDLDDLSIRNFTERQAYLASTPFRLATKAEIQNLVQFSFDPAVVWHGHMCVRLPPGYAADECNKGIYDDSATGVDPNRPGLAGAERTGSQTSYTIQDDATDIPGTSYWGTWAVQKLGSNCSANSGVDFDCDGKDDKVVWRSSTGTWYIKLTSTTDPIVEQWGLPGDIPMLGDYDGDHIPDLVVWRPSNGTWYVKTSSSLFDANQTVSQQFGLPGDVPIRGDFDSDGILDYTVWRPSEGNWYVLRSSDHQAVVEQWGLPGDVPLIGGRP